MKKLFLSMLAAVTLFASCSEDEVVSQSNEETSAMTFTVSTSEIASRALGDGTAATQLYYAVYDETNQTAEMVESISKTEESDPINSSTNVTLSLLNGHTYSIIFWAESGKGMCTVDWENKTISLKETLASNQENYDAFYAYVAPFKVTSSKTEAVKMYRPFAQMNIGTTSKDLAGLATYYGSGTITKSQLKVKTYTSMDLTTGEASDKKELTYKYAAFDTKEDFPITGYQYLSMNYLLVNNEKELVDVTLELSDDTETVASKTFTSVPVQRNYRTNIYGQLFTSQTDWSVELLPEFEGAYTVLSGHVTLQKDMIIDKPLVVTSGDVVLDLNGKSITTTNGSDAIIVKEGTLTIKGEGSVTTEDNTAGYAVTANGSNAVVNIYGGTYTIGLDNVETYGTIACNSAVYTQNGGKANIYGGIYQVSTKQTAPDPVSKTRFLINENDNNRNTITIYGGTYVEFNPANNVAEGIGTNFLAEGYSSALVGENSWIVAKGTAVATADALSNALANNDEVSLVADVTLSSPLNIKKDVTLNLLKGKTLTNKKENTATDVIIVEKDATLTINGEGTVEAVSGIDGYPVIADGTVIINGGTFITGKDANDEQNAGIYARGNGKVYINGGTFQSETGKFLVNKKDADRETTIIEIRGGSFYKFDPANNASEGAGTNFVAEGYQSVIDSTGDWYNVVEK